MKRSLFALLVVAVAAIWLGTLAARDPGYVLIAYGGATIQTGLWVFLALVAVSALVMYYSWRLLKRLLMTTGYIRAWRDERQKNKSSEHTIRGLTFFQEGDMERAERFLLSGAVHSERPAINYLYAARAADALGRPEQREECLRKAREKDPETGGAVAIASAEMALARHDYEACIAYLKDAGTSDVVVRLRCEAMLARRDWQGLMDLLPHLKKAARDEAELFALQKRIAIERLSETPVTDEGLGIIYKKLPDAVARDPQVVTRYCERLTGEAAAEAAIRGCLKNQWIPELVERYGELGATTLSRRIKTAEGWQSKHGDDAALHFCLGALYELQGEKDKAMTAYKQSLDIAPGTRAGHRLGRLAAFDGDYKQATEYLLRT